VGGSNGGLLEPSDDTIGLCCYLLFVVCIEIFSGQVVCSMMALKAILFILISENCKYLPRSIKSRHFNSAIFTEWHIVKKLTIQRVLRVSIA
jgi:hypothetical protein